MNTPTIAEIVTFRLKEGTNADDFTMAAGQMTAFLRSTGALVSRSLSTDDAGLCADHLLWTTEAKAKQAAKAMFERPAAVPFMEMIDTTDMSMRHAKLALYYPPEQYAQN